MQPLTASPRSQYTEAQMVALLTGPKADVDMGCDLLAPDLTFLEDLRPWITPAGSKVERDMLAPVHSSCDLVISKELEWGRARVRPYLLLSSELLGLQNVRWNQGVYCPVEPGDKFGETPQSWTVSAFDQLSRLGGVGDSHSELAGTNVLNAVRTCLALAGNLAPVLLDSTASAKVLAATKTWALTSSESPTWLVIVNELLASVGYRGLWADWDGNLRSGPYILPEDRPSEWLFDVGNPESGIVAQPRERTNPLWSAPNWWRFIRNGMDVEPTEGAGRYTVQNPDIGLSSQASMGIVRAPVQFLDAVDQAALKTQGDRAKAADMRSTELINISLSPFPAAWHADRGLYRDSDLGADRQVLARGWVLPLDGADGTMRLETVA